MDPKWIKLRKYNETEWIITLRTAYPFSFNDIISDGIKWTISKKVGINFLSLKRMYDSNNW